jgi:CubicO group peptidase (beta-lactamase class C family)
MKALTRHLRGVSALALLAAAVLAPLTAAVAPTAGAEPPRRGAAAGVGPGDPREVEAFFDELLPRQLREEHVVGAAVAVVQDGRLLFAKGYGYADLERRRPVEAERTLFYPGSAGKLFTWTAVMQQVELGRLDLHADVNDYLDFRIPATYDRPITLAHLLTHTAGFAEEMGVMLAAGQEDVPPLRELLIDRMPARVYPPGQLSAYSNYGTALAGYVVERVSGEPFEQYVAAHILQPLGMTRSAAVQPLPPDLAPDLSKGYTYRGGAYEALDFEWVAAAPAAPVRATVTDVARFMIAHLDDGRYGDGGARLLEEATAREMHRQQFTHHPALAGLAYGFIVSHENGQDIVWHDGGTPRFLSHLVLLPEHRTGLFVSYNTPPADPRAVATAFLDRYFPAGPPPAPLAADGGAHLADLAGTYVPARVAPTSAQKLVDWIKAVEVAQDGDHRVLLAGRPYAEVEPGVFQQVGGERRLAFGRDARGHVRYLFWGPIAYLRVPWYQAPLVQLGLLAACLAVFASALVAWPVHAWIGRRRGDPPPPRAARAARWLAALVAVAAFALIGWYVGLLLGFGETYVFPTARVATLTRLTWLVPGATVAVLALAVVAWRRHFWSVPWRAHYSAVAGAAVVLVGCLAFWNLLGPA